MSKRKHDDRVDVYIVGRELGLTSDGYVAYEVCGVYTDVEKARSLCTTEDHFVGPLPLDEDLPEEEMEWEVEYPFILQHPRFD